MEKLVDGFILQLKDSVKIAERQNVVNSKKINNVLICGLGGSGIGGSIVSQLVATNAIVPITICKDYFIPQFVSENTLTIFSSYSGNTEETLQALEQAEKKNPQIVCITSGGKLAEIATAKKYECVTIPSGFPPRAAFGYSSVQLFYLLSRKGLISLNVAQDFANTIKLLEDKQTEIRTEAKKLAENLLGKIPVLYSDATFEGVCVRWRQQINENAKMLCWHHAIPEMNHNELVGWRETRGDIAVVILRNHHDFDRTQTRIQLNKEIISNYCPNIYEVWSEGKSHIERAYYLINIGDWVSVYLSELKNIDPMEVRVIDFLKGELAKK